MPRSIKETDGGGDPSSGDEDGVPVDPPHPPPSTVLELAWSAQMPVLVRAPRNPRSRTGRSPY